MINSPGHDWKSLVVLALASACGSRGKVDTSAQPTTTLQDAQRQLSDLPVTARISIPSSADWITFGFGSVWVVNYRPDRVSRIDASTNRVAADIPIGPNGCLGIVEAIDRIWVASCGDGRMNEIDPKRDSVVRRIPIPVRRGREGSFAFANGSFWIPDNVADSGSTSIAKVDARTGAVVAHVTTGARSDVAVAGFGSVWVASSAEDVVVRVDPERNTVIARIPVGGSPKFMAAGEGAMWVQNRSDGSVSRIDPKTNREVARVEARAPTRAGDIAVGGGAVWLSVDGKPVTKIDPRTNRVVQQYVAGNGADAIRFGLGSVWVADHRIGELWRIDPRKIR